MDVQVVLDFWFKELDSSHWFNKDQDIDKLIADRFTDIYNSAAKGRNHCARSIYQKYF